VSALRSALLIALLAPTPALAQQPGNPIDARVGGSFNAAESYQGPLDGSWTLVSTSGQPLLAFQVVDRPGGQAQLEGVWRDLRRPVIPGDIGFIDDLQRGPGSLTITLRAAPDAPPLSVTLHADPTGAWSGTLHENGADAPVKLRRQ
jgi:hypothetical protein